ARLGHGRDLDRLQPAPELVSVNRPSMGNERASTDSATSPSDPWSDLVLTLPMFIGYHLGVIFLPIRNAADVVTRELVALAGHDRAAYGGLTLAIGLAYVLVLGLA